MKEPKLKIPISAINPLYGIVTFDWFVFLLRSILKNNDINVYVIHNNSYKEMRKNSSSFVAKLSKMKIVNTIMGIENVSVIGDYDTAKVFVVSTANLTKELDKVFKEAEIKIVIGATASIENDSEFTILDRAIKAINLAQSKNIPFQRL